MNQGNKTLLYLKQVISAVPGSDYSVTGSSQTLKAESFRLMKKCQVTLSNETMGVLNPAMSGIFFFFSPYHSFPVESSFTEVRSRPSVWGSLGFQ